MSLTKKILAIWTILVLAFLASFLLPHTEVTTAGVMTNAALLLLFILSVYLVRRETLKQRKWIFVNLAAFFSLSFLFHLYPFIGTEILPEVRKAQHYFYQYISLGLYFFLLAFAISYITIDLLFREFSVVQKYLLTFVIVGGFFGYYYQPYFSDPDYLYTRQEIAEWKELDKAVAALEAEGRAASEEEVVRYVQSSGEFPFLGRLGLTDLRLKVNELSPYLPGSNYMILLLRPIYLNTIYMCVLSLGMILLYFGYQYKKDPPQGAYIEKIMFFFLLFCSLEAFHAWSFIKTLEWREFSGYLNLSQYLSAVVLACGAVLFALRLRFITSPYGEFYEQEIAEHPWSITRWRDALDNLMIRHFFNRNPFVGRFFLASKVTNKE